MKKGFFGQFIVADALTKSNQESQKVKLTKALYEIEDLLWLLQTTSEKINQNLSVAEAHFV